MHRPTWDDTIHDLLATMSRRATCPRLHTAAAIVSVDYRPLAFGYNGSVYGLPHCDDEDTGCLIIDGHCARTIHAEENAILNAAREGIATKGTLFYSMHLPCMGCAKLIAQAGVKSVTIFNSYDSRNVMDFLESVQIPVYRRYAHNG